jgi:N-acyl-D-aspartate/D-glutamate deacylase
MPLAADVVIRNALIADGNGGPLTDGDVAIGGGRILTAGAEPAQAGPATVALDARGAVVCTLVSPMYTPTMMPR